MPDFSQAPTRKIDRKRVRTKEQIKAPMQQMTIVTRNDATSAMTIAIHAKKGKLRSHTFPDDSTARGRKEDKGRTRESVDDGDDNDDVSASSTTEPDRQAGGDGKNRGAVSDNEVEVSEEDE